MAINPVVFARTVNEQFLRYQLTAFPLTDGRLARQAEEAIRGTGGRPTSLIMGPYPTLSKAFGMGPSVEEVVARGVVHPAIAGIVEHPAKAAPLCDTLHRARSGR